MARTGSSGGKRAGARRGPRPRRQLRPSVLLLALGITVAVIAWGYLVYTAIDFGGDARGGDDRAWGFLALAALGAVACLFIGLMLLARLSRALGLTSQAAPTIAGSPEPQRADARTYDAPLPPGPQAPRSPHRHRAE